MDRQLSQSPARGLMGTLAVLGGVGIAVSLVVALGNLAQDHHAAFGTSSDGVIWGLPVVNYVFFVLASTGLTFVASLAMVFGMKQYYPIAKRCVWLAVATLIAGFVSLAFELGHPFRMLWAIPLGAQLRSPLNWMGVLYLSYLAFLALKFRKMDADDWDSSASRRLGQASFVTVIVAHATLGLAFGMIATRPFWFGGMTPVYFLLTALLSGVAFAVLSTYLAYGFDTERMPAPVRALLAGSMPGFFATALGITLVAVAARTITGLWSHQDGFQAFDQMVASPWFHVEIWAGMVLPLVLLVLPGTRTSGRVQIVASSLVLVALFIGRYEFIIGGQAVPVFKGIAMGEFASYTPSLTEIMLTVLSASIVVALYAVGERYLRLDAAPRSAEEPAGWVPEPQGAGARAEPSRAQYAPASAD